jgi:hypothetical protein
MMDFQKFLYWERSTLDTITLKKSYVDMTLDLNAGVVLGEIVREFSEYLPDIDETSWVVMRRHEFWNRVRLTPRQADRALKILIDGDFIRTEVRHLDSKPALHIQLNWERFSESWESKVNVKRMLSKSPNGKLPNGKLPNGDLESEPLINDTYNESGESDEDNVNINYSVEKNLIDEPSQDNMSRADYRKSQTLKALQRHEERNAGLSKDIQNYLAKVPENTRELARVFCAYMGRPPTNKKEDSFWRKCWNEQSEQGLSATHVESALREMDDSNLTVKSPHSVSAIAFKHKRKDDTRNDSFFKATEIYVGEDKVK